MAITTRLAGPNLIGIVGSGLAGLAAAARLATAGHRVCVFEKAEVSLNTEICSEPGGTIFTLPQVWRDLFASTGPELDAELAKLGLALAPAPAHPQPGASGRSLRLPAGRSEQWAAICDVLGESAASRWQELLDHLDEVWLAVQSIGLTRPFVSTGFSPAERAILQPRRSLSDLAAVLPWPELGELVLNVAAWMGQSPSQLPAWHAFRLAMERRFGRWQLLDSSDQPLHPKKLAELLLGRLIELGVEVRPNTEVRSIRRGPLLNTGATTIKTSAVISTVNPFVQAELTRERPDQRIARASYPAPTAGPLWRGWRTLFELPRLEPSLPLVLVASAWSPAGPDAWAQLSTGALAADELHHQLTGSRAE